MFQPLDPSPQLLTGSLTIMPQGVGAPSISDLAMMRARLFLNCFRQGQAENPAIFATALAAILSTYPEDVIISVTEPTSKLATDSNWLPSLKELKDACEVAMRPRYEAASREAERKRVEEQIAERERLAAVHLATDPERVARLAAEFREVTKARVKKFRGPNDMTEEEAKIKLAHTKPVPSDIPVSPWLRKEFNRMVVDDLAPPSDDNGRRNA